MAYKLTSNGILRRHRVYMGQSGGSWKNLTGEEYSFTSTRLIGQTVYSNVFGGGGSMLAAEGLDSDYTPEAVTVQFIIDTAFPVDVVLVVPNYGVLNALDSPYIEVISLKDSSVRHNWIRGTGENTTENTWEAITSENIDCYYWGTYRGVRVAAGTTGVVFEWHLTTLANYFTTGNHQIRFGHNIKIIPITATEESYTASGHFEVKKI